MYAQTNLMLGFEFALSDNLNWSKGNYVITNVIPHFPAQRAGLKQLDIILAVDDKPTIEMDMQTLNNNLFGQVGSSIKLTIKKIGQKLPQIYVLKNQEPLPASCFTEGRLRNNLISFANRNLKNSYFNLASSDSKRTTMRDPEAQFENYNTFDFEFTNQDDPLLEKKLASILESSIIRKGLKRDRENPDLLVFINMFTGNEKQFVPPTQKISTRYQFGYDIWSGWGNRQYVESQQTEGYTKVDYFATLKLVFMDAQKAKQQVKVPPIVWQSEENLSSKSPIDLQVIAYNIYSTMMDNYPVNEFNIKNSEVDVAALSGSITHAGNYFYTGLCYDVNQPNLVVYVYPESPATKAGIVVGDKIIAVNARKMPSSVREMEMDYLYQIKKAQESKKSASVLDNGTIKSGFSYIIGDYENIQHKIPLTFDIERQGRQQSVLVNPEIWCYQGNLPNLYKFKQTEFEAASKGNIGAFGFGMEIPKNTQFFPIGITPLNGYSFYIGLDQATSRNWRMINDYAFTWYKTGLLFGNKTNLLEAKWILGPGVKLFPNFYVTACVGFGGYFFLVDNNDAANISLFKVYFIPGVHLTIARSIYLFGRYNMSSGTSQSVDFGIKFRM
jgi:hypothetical protein